MLIEWMMAVMMLIKPYTGPLADRVIELPDDGLYGVICLIEPIGPDARRIRALARRLEGRPLAVLAPGLRHAGYGLGGGKGTVFVLRFNTLFADAARAFQRSGQYPEGEDDLTIAGAAAVMQSGHANAGEALEWALAALRWHGIEHPPYWFADVDDDGTTPDYPSLIADWKAHGSHFDRELVRRLLVRWGRPVPTDL
ncbi:MAG: hypothetical protein H6703_11760 [Myxococcales bacterium]|nr:hypothetical protein [Myxococcales bacterium]